MISSMSRREIAVNVGLGAVLLLIFAVPFILFIGAGALLVRALNPLLAQHFSSLGFPSGLWLLLPFGVIALWKRYGPAGVNKSGS